MKQLVVVGLVVALGISHLAPASTHVDEGVVKRRSGFPDVKIMPELNVIRANFDKISEKPIDLGQVRLQENKKLVPAKISNEDLALEGLNAVEDFYLGLSACEIKQNNSTKKSVEFVEKFIVWLKDLSGRKAPAGRNSNLEIFEESRVQEFMWNFKKLVRVRDEHYSDKSFSGWSSEQAKHEADLFGKVEKFVASFIPGFKTAAPTAVTSIQDVASDAQWSVSKEGQACLLKPGSVAPQATNPPQVVVNPPAPIVDQPIPSESPSPEASPSPTESPIVENDGQGDGGGDGGANVLAAQKKELDDLKNAANKLAGDLEKAKNTKTTPPSQAPFQTPTNPLSGLENLAGLLNPQRDQQQPQPGQPPQQAQQPQQQQQPQVQPENDKKGPTPEELAAMQRAQQNQGQPGIIPGASSANSSQQQMQPQPSPIAAAPTPLPDPSAFSKNVTQASSQLAAATDQALLRYFAGQQQQQAPMGPMTGQMMGPGGTPPNPLQSMYNRGMAFGRSAVNAIRGVFAGRAAPPSQLAGPAR